MVGECGRRRGAAANVARMTLCCQNVDFGFRTPVARDLSATFEPGLITALIGPNGCGKTTLLRLLLGLLEPAGGRCTIAGQDVRRLSPTARAALLAFVPHRPSVEYAYSIREFVGFSHALRPPAPQAIDSAMRSMELQGLADASMLELSAGQAQRASIARALAQIRSSSAHGRFLLADEPTNALDAKHLSACTRALRNLADEGAGVVVSMHDLSIAAAIADAVVVLDGSGKVAHCGSIDLLRDAALLERVFGCPFDVVEVGDRVLIAPQTDRRPVEKPVILQPA